MPGRRVGLAGDLLAEADVSRLGELWFRALTAIAAHAAGVRRPHPVRLPAGRTVPSGHRAAGDGPARPGGAVAADAAAGRVAVPRAVRRARAGRLPHPARGRAVPGRWTSTRCGRRRRRCCGTTRSCGSATRTATHPSRWCRRRSRCRGRSCTARTSSGCWRGTVGAGSTCRRPRWSGSRWSGTTTGPHARHHQPPPDAGRVVDAGAAA